MKLLVAADRTLLGLESMFYMLVLPPWHSTLIQKALFPSCFLLLSVGSPKVNKWLLTPFVRLLASPVTISSLQPVVLPYGTKFRHWFCTLTASWCGPEQTALCFWEENQPSGVRGEYPGLCKSQEAKSEHHCTGTDRGKSTLCLDFQHSAHWFFSCFNQQLLLFLNPGL